MQKLAPICQEIMVLTVLIAFGVVSGGSEGLKASQAKARREEHRSRKNNLIVHVPKSSEHSQILESRRVVLSGDKVSVYVGPVQQPLHVWLTGAQLYIDTGLDNDAPFGHPFEGYYLAYPGTTHAGLVSSITEEAPIMNWIYMDALTYEMKFGTRQWAEGNLTGPFDCTRQDRRMTLAGYEGFVAVKEGNFWSLYFDWDGDRLKSKVADGTPVIDVDLLRQEMRVRRPPKPALPPPQQTFSGSTQTEQPQTRQPQPQQPKQEFHMRMEAPQG